jgi:small conductance mechanosensitive channel
LPAFAAGQGRTANRGLKKGGFAMAEVFVNVQQWIALYGLRIVAAVIILLLGWWVARIFRSAIQRMMEKRQADRTLVSFVSSLAYVAVWIFVFVAALSKLGVQTASIIAVVGAAGLAIALSLQGSLANLAAGIMLIALRPFKAGDYIEGGGAGGTVDQVRIFATRLISPDNKVITVPNSKMIGDNIVNYSVMDTRRMDLTFGAGYGDDVDTVKRLLQEIAEADSRILQDPAPKIALQELADSSVNFLFRVWVARDDYWDVYFDLPETVKKRFDAGGVSIPFPQTDVHIYQAA